MFKAIIASHDPLILKILPIVIHACEILREEYQRYCAGNPFNVERKSDDSPVTQADFRVNQWIVEQLKINFPDIPTLSEEQENKQRKTWQKFWLLDPLDGTKEFLHKRSEFTINLSLVEGSKTTFAMIVVPEEMQIYICPLQGLPLKYQIKTQQWLSFEHHQPSEIIQVGVSQSSQNKPQYAEFLNKLKQHHLISTIKAGSAYKFCMMLEGSVDLYPRFHPTCEWDTSAGQCLLERIGGGLVDFKGRAFTYNQRNHLLNNGFIAFCDENIKKIAFEVLEQRSHIV